MLREVNDFNPRVQLKILFGEGNISLNNIPKIDEFVRKYIVDKPIVMKALEEMQASQITTQAKQREKKRQREINEKKAYKDYDWKDAVENGGLKKLLVIDLDKYIIHHKLRHLLNKNKPQKIEGIRLHYMRNCVEESENNGIRRYTRNADSGLEDAPLPSTSMESLNSEAGDMGDAQDNQLDSSSDYDSSDDEVVLDLNPVPKEVVTLSSELCASLSGEDNTDSNENSDTDRASNDDADTDNSFEDPALFRVNRFGRTVGSSSASKAKYVKP